MSLKVKSVIDIFEAEILCELAALRDSHQNNRANFSFQIRNYLKDRFQGIVHQTEWLFEYPDVEVKQEPLVKDENVLVPEVNGSCGPGPSSSQQSTPSKRSSTEPMSKSPKKQKMENDSMKDGSENNIVPQNDLKNGEGSQTPVTRSHSKEIPSSLFGFSFYCGNCEGEAFELPDQVHAHWLQKHMGDKPDPFTFRVSNLASCYYCDYSGADTALRTHNCKERGTNPIVFVDFRDVTQCAMCPFKGDNIVAHASVEHALVSELKIHNPIGINEASLKALLEFNSYKKIKCGHCKNEFSTEHQFVRHNREHHPHTTPKPVRKFKSEPKLYLPCCNMTIDEKVFVYHFQNHPPNFACIPCNQNYPTLVDAIEHDKNEHGIKDAYEKRFAEFKRQMKKDYLSTEIRYPNGLVLNMQNLLATSHSKEPNFNAFVADLAKMKQEKSKDSGTSSQAK